MEINEIQDLAVEHLPGIKKAFDPLSITRYGQDSNTLYESSASLILFPETIEEVVRIVLFANRFRVAIVPSGGRTGLCGGATATAGEMVLSLEKFTQEPVFDENNDSVMVTAGTVTGYLQQKAARLGLLFPINFAAAGSSTIGGNIATNAGGVHVIRYGMMRDWVTGLTVVTGKGEVLELNNGLIKNATGYDLRHLFIGSEGTLGIVVSATLRLAKEVKSCSTLLLTFYRVEQIPLLLSLLKKHIDLLAFEFFSDIALATALDEGTFAFAFEKHYPFYAVIEYENVHDPHYNTTKEKRDNFVVDLVMETGLVADGKIAFGENERVQFWKHREQIPVAIMKFDPYKNDISVRPAQIADFVIDLEELFNSAYGGLKLLLFGHIGDGNLHVNIPKPPELSKEDFKFLCDDLSKNLYGLVRKYKGSISAEHGVGLAKKEFLTFTRSKEEIAYLDGIKSVFDPNRILNPGKIF